jgi:hypothetical protein
MSHFMLQLNYFPKRLHSVVAPTDTRRRPDQRALENGDMKLAGAEKHRLEEKQRAVRKYREAHHIEPKPAYFEEWTNPEDGITYWRYNNRYFEHDREKQDWSRLDDIFSEKLPPEVDEFLKKK